MLLIYFDESKNEEEHKYYHIGAVAVAEENLNLVEERIAAIADGCFGTSALTSDTELHATEIYHRKRNFKTWSDFDRRVAVLGSLIDVLCMPEVILLNVRVNCAKLYAGVIPSDVAFMFLVEKADALARQEGTIAMLIGDRESDRFTERYATALSDYRAQGTGFAFGRDIDHLVDSVHFTHSHLSRFLQLADAYTWVLQFKLRNHESTNPRHRAVLQLLEGDEVDLFPRKYKIWPP